MKTRGKKAKRKRGASSAGMSFGELIRKLWEPRLEEFEPKLASVKRSKSVRKGKRIRKR